MHFAKDLNGYAQSKDLPDGALLKYGQPLAPDDFELLAIQKQEKLKRRKARNQIKRTTLAAKVQAALGESSDDGQDEGGDQIP